MTQSLVPQVPQLTFAQIEEHIPSNPMTYEECCDYASFQLGDHVNRYLRMFWRLSESIKIKGRPSPFCLHSPHEDGAWNFSWGLDNPATGESTRSCLYRFFPDDSVWCREYPNDEIQLRTGLDAYNLVCVIISDLIQSHDWDKQATADRIDALVQKQMQQMDK